MCAAQNQHQDVVQLLLKARADKDITCTNSQTAMMLALEVGNASANGRSRPVPPRTCDGNSNA